MSTIKKCKIDDEYCLIKTTNAILESGDYKKFGLHAIDTFDIEKLDIEQGGNISVSIRVRNVTLYGISQSKVYKFTGFQQDPDKNKLEIRYKAPIAIIKGPYQISGRMLAFPVQGKGNITLNFENVDVVLKFLTKKVVRDGKVHMHIEKSKFNFDVTGFELNQISFQFRIINKKLFFRANVNLTNLLNGFKAIGNGK